MEVLSSCRSFACYPSRHSHEVVDIQYPDISPPCDACMINVTLHNGCLFKSGVTIRTNMLTTSKYLGVLRLASKHRRHVDGKRCGEMFTGMCYACCQTSSRRTNSRLRRRVRGMQRMSDATQVQTSHLVQSRTTAISGTCTRIPKTGTSVPLRQSHQA